MPEITITRVEITKIDPVPKMDLFYGLNINPIPLEFDNELTTTKWLCALQSKYNSLIDMLNIIIEYYNKLVEYYKDIGAEEVLQNVQQLLKDVENLQAEDEKIYSTINNRFNQLNSYITEIRNQITSINGTLTQHTSSINNINTTLTEHAEELNQINRDLTDLESKIQQINNKIGTDTLLTTSKNLSGAINELYNSIQNLEIPDITELERELANIKKLHIYKSWTELSADTSLKDGDYAIITNTTSAVPTYLYLTNFPSGGGIYYYNTGIHVSGGQSTLYAGFAGKIIYISQIILQSSDDGFYSVQSILHNADKVYLDINYNYRYYLNNQLGKMDIEGKFLSNIKYIFEINVNHSDESEIYNYADENVAVKISNLTINYYIKNSDITLINWTFSNCNINHTISEDITEFPKYKNCIFQKCNITDVKQFENCTFYDCNILYTSDNNIQFKDCTFCKINLNITGNYALYMDLYNCNGIIYKKDKNSTYLGGNGNNFTIYNKGGIRYNYFNYNQVTHIQSEGTSYITENASYNTFILLGTAQDINYNIIYGPTSQSTSKKNTVINNNMGVNADTSKWHYWN